ncbi:MAG: Uma2 family endonuclease [Planctomycetota bacterium]
MSSPEIHTAEQYTAHKLDLPEGGRWTELVVGEVVTLEPPDDQHGNVVRNLMLAFSKFAHKTQLGYACCEIGLVTKRIPDTVRCPPVSYFVSGPQFVEIDNLVARTKPAVVVEIASTNDRRRQMENCILEYQEWGVPLIWVVDPHDKKVHVFQHNRSVQHYSEHQILYGSSILDGFEYPVGDLFALPPWWNAKVERGQTP